MLGLLFALISNASASPPSIVLEVGQEKTIPQASSLRLQENSVVRAVPSGSGFKLIGMKPGFTTVVVKNQSQDIHVLSKTQTRTQRFLEKWTAHRMGLSATLEKGEVILSGRLLRAKDWLDLLKECRNCQFRSRFEMAEDLSSTIEQDLRAITAGRGLSSPALRWNPSATWLVRKPAAGLEPIASSLGIQIQKEDSTVDLAPLIRTEIFVLEAKRSRTRQWGVQWPEAVTAQVLPKKVDPFSVLSMTAKALETDGDAKILASPTLLCRSGQEAEFFAGGEFPIKIVNLRTRDVVWKKYGIALKVKPVADRFGRMSLSLATEISSLDSSRTVDGIPALFTNKVMSHFDLAEPKTIAISGLIKNEDGESMQGLPGASRIPVLGALFGSKEFRENRTELLILVRPSVVSPDEVSYD